MKNLSAPIRVVFAVALLATRAPAAPSAFRVGSGELNVRVEHPFQVVQLTTGEFKGAFALDRADLTHGVTLEAHVPTGAMLPGGSLGSFLQARLAPEVVFQATQVETLIREPGPETNPFQMVLRGRLVNGDSVSDARVRLDCTNDGPAMRCQVHSRFPITALGMAVPRMLWVKAHNEIALDGEVFFAPQGETKK